MATMIVRERSGAEMPVVMPCRASMASVKAVALGVSLRRTIGFSPSCSQRSSVSDRQISPRPWVAMKLIASGVANCAAITRSPSFSRSSESRITTMRPARISSIASATEANWAVLLVIRRPSRTAVGRCQGLHVFCHHVHLEIDGAPGRLRPEGRDGDGVGDQGDREARRPRRSATVRLTPSTAMLPFSTT